MGDVEDLLHELFDTTSSEEEDNTIVGASAFDPQPAPTAGAPWHPGSPLTDDPAWRGRVYTAHGIQGLTHVKGFLSTGVQVGGRSMGGAPAGMANIIFQQCPQVMAHHCPAGTLAARNRQRAMVRWRRRSGHALR